MQPLTREQASRILASVYRSPASRMFLSLQPVDQNYAVETPTGNLERKSPFESYWVAMFDDTALAQNRDETFLRANYRHVFIDNTNSKDRYITESDQPITEPQLEEIVL